MKPDNLRYRLLTSIVKDANGCWVYQNTPNRIYGQIKIAGINYTVHRVAYEEFIGEIPQGLQVLHKCDVPKCINPKHLFVGTQLDNMQDCKRKGRMKKAAGLASGVSKLTPSLVNEIRSLHTAGKRIETLALKFNISESQVKNVINYKHWKSCS